MTDQSSSGSPNELDVLWSRIPWPELLGEADIRTGLEKSQRRVEICEILSSVLWRLQIVEALGPLPHNPMDATRLSIQRSTGGVAWQLWGRVRPQVHVVESADAISVTMRFGERVPAAARYLLQSSLVADAALRLAGAFPTLESLVGAQKASARSAAASWAENGEAATDLDAKSTALVLAFRDGYMHSAVSDARQTGPLRHFRSGMWKKYSLSEVHQSCLSVWERMSNALSSAM